jgi:hypothetical protein
MCDSSWLDWLLGLNIYLPFSITFGTSTPGLPLTLLWCMVHRGQVSLILLQLPSCLTYHSMSSIDPFLKIFFLWLSCLHRYPLLRSNIWLILSLLWVTHKCWTKLMFIIFLFICFSCLTCHRLFNMERFTCSLHMLITLFYFLHNCTPRDISMNTTVFFI